MDNELAALLLKLLAGSAIVMVFIALACLVTPKIAKAISRRHPEWNSPERVEDSNETGTASEVNGDEPSVKGAYDAQHEDYDLNYKIYNKDIYGVDFKHGKKKRKNG